MRHILVALAWLAAVVLIALGAAGLLAGLDTPATAGSRPWLTARDDAPITGQLDAVTADLVTVSERLDELGVQARGALSALVANDPSRAATALDAGDALIADITTRSAAIEKALAAVPLIGTTAAEYRLSPAVRARHARLTAALVDTRGLEGAWASLAIGSAAATRLSNLLAAHDETVVAAAKQGREAEYAKGLEVLAGAAAAITDARRLRDQLAKTVDVATLDQWLERSGGYDVALRDLYTALDKSGGKINNTVRAAMAAEEKAKDRLPPDTRSLVIIMAEIGRGGMNSAVISIEEARGQLAEALAEPTASPAP